MLKGVDFVTASVDVERHARDFMEAAKKLQLYFIGLQREDQPTKVETLRKVTQSLFAMDIVYCQ
jgi:hypothetical protein